MLRLALGLAPGTEAIGRELFAGEMDKPDVVAKFPFLAHLRKSRRSQHHCRGRRMIIIRSARGHPGTAAAILLVVSVNHECGIVVVGHDHGPAPILSRNHDEHIAAGGFLIFEPTAHP